jgi:hypothetical protein
MIDLSPLPWGEGGESSEPGEGFLPTELRNFGIRDYSRVRASRGASQKLSSPPVAKIRRNTGPYGQYGWSQAALPSGGRIRIVPIL